MARSIVSKVKENIRRVRAKKFVKQKMTPAIPWDEFRKIEGEFTDAERYYKYFKTDQYLVRSAERVYRLGLEKGEPRRILDLGCGFGYFMLACKVAGHHPVGVDLSSPLFDRVIQTLGLKKTVHRIEQYEQLPDIDGGPFDLITAYEICFDSTDGKVWGIPQWVALLNDLASRMTPTGDLMLKFNDRPNIGIGLHSELKKFFKGLGAEIDGRAVFVPKLPSKLAAHPEG